MVHGHHLSQLEEEEALLSDDEETFLDCEFLTKDDYSAKSFKINLKICLTF